MRAALLMLPERFTEEDLFVKIAGLSYRGKSYFLAEKIDFE
jgi:hypothetical protein